MCDDNSLTVAGKRTRSTIICYIIKPPNKHIKKLMQICKRQKQIKTEHRGLIELSSCILP